MLKNPFVKLFRTGLKFIVLKKIRSSANNSEVYSDKNIDFFCKKFEEYWLSNCPNIEYKKILFDKEVFIWMKTKGLVNLYVSENNFNKMVYSYIINNKAKREKSFFSFNFYNTYIHKSLSLSLNFYENYYNNPKFLNTYNLCLSSFSSGFKKFLAEDKTISKYSFIPLSYL